MCSLQAVKSHKRLSPLCTSENRKNGCVALPPPFRQRIIHLLALKAYRKSELLLWMERERASPRNKAELDGILEEVGSNAVIIFFDYDTDEMFTC